MRRSTSLGPSPARPCARLRRRTSGRLSGSDGDILISWVRRSRLGWAWIDGSDTPLGEESEAYSLILSGMGFERALTLAQPSYVYSAAQQLEDGLSGALTVTVRQLGTVAASRPAQIVFG